MSVATETTLEEPVIRKSVPTFLLASVVIFLWAQLSLKLSADWTTNLQYEFGFFVPFFILFLAFRRWEDRPTPQSHGRGWPLVLGGGIFLFLMLPIRLVEEANPDWRPLNWVHAGLVVTLTLMLLCLLGGPGWVKHFGLPLFLIFFALPWPLAIEQSVIQSMARGVAAATTELLNLIGVPAMQDGNVIRVPTGPVGIEDACTGVRSLAGTLMASVFFGEFYRLVWWRRLILVGSGVVIAFALNLIRTSLLGFIAASKGIEAISDWHDQAGFLIFCAAFGALWLLGEALSRFNPSETKPRNVLVPVRSIGASVLIGVVAWLAFIEVATETWYRMGERNLPRFSSWSPTWPAEDQTFKFVGVADEARAVLRYNEGRAAVLDEPGSPKWQIFFFRWEAGRTSSQLAVLHRPDICLPAAGLKTISSGGTAAVSVGGATLHFEAFVFDSGGVPLYVFRNLSEDRREPGVSSGFDQSIKGRLLGTWSARRNLGQKLLQIGILGPENQQAALDDLQSRLPRFVHLVESEQF